MVPCLFCLCMRFSSSAHGPTEHARLACHNCPCTGNVLTSMWAHRPPPTPSVRWQCASHVLVRLEGSDRVPTVRAHSLSFDFAVSCDRSSGYGTLRVRSASKWKTRVGSASEASRSGASALCTTSFRPSSPGRGASLVCPSMCRLRP